MDNLEDRKIRAMSEYNEVSDWAIAESEKVVKRLKEQGVVMGLDGCRENFNYIREYKQKRLKEIIIKYDLPYNI